MSSYYVEDLEVQSGKASPGKRRSSPDPETKVSGKLATEEETNRDGKYPTPYTSQNPWTILGSSGQIRIRHLKHANPDILVFACSDTVSSDSIEPEIGIARSIRPEGEKKDMNS